MKPVEIIGMPYRLGATPENNKAVDCLSLARSVLLNYGIRSPEPTREWYRRLRKKDYSIFKEQLELWGIKTKTLRLCTVGLCRTEQGYGLCIYWEDGWLNCGESAARWSPIGALQVEEFYYPQKRNFVTPSD
tara:strand:+ start:108 stop:503 length:396 start_codon:yes stop_codon:yes gene_type:complete